MGRGLNPCRKSYRGVRAFRNRGFASKLSDLIWPPRSLLSEKIVDRPCVIEPELWGERHFLGPPQCRRCGFPLPEEVGETAVCGACAGREPAFDTAPRGACLMTIMRAA